MKKSDSVRDFYEEDMPKKPEPIQISFKQEVSPDISLEKLFALVLFLVVIVFLFTLFFHIINIDYGSCICSTLN